jgi:CDP-diacylglycerol---serine O-phosphatidyltransferase
MNVDLKSFRLVLPSSITSLSILCGLFAIFQVLVGTANHGTYTVSCWLIIVAGLIDGIDGKVARLTNSSSEFGIQYDSIADIITFGVAGTVVIFRQVVADLVAISPAYYLIPVIYLLCGAIRLARFNVTATTGAKKCFYGMPAPTAAISVMALFLFMHALENIYGVPLSEALKVRVSVFGVLLVSLLMVSRVEFSIFARFFFIENRKHWVRFAFNVLIVGYMVAGYVLFDDAGTAFFLLGVFYIGYHLTLAAGRRLCARAERRGGSRASKAV